MYEPEGEPAVQRTFSISKLIFPDRHFAATEMELWYDGKPCCGDVVCIGHTLRTLPERFPDTSVFDAEFPHGVDEVMWGIHSAFDCVGTCWYCD